MIKEWYDEAWDDCLWWQTHDRKTPERISQLIRDIEHDPFNGIGKPEPLRHEFSGMWSRRIDAANRLVYSISGDRLCIYSAKDHYA